MAKFTKRPVATCCDSLPRLVQKKNGPEKISFMAANKWIVSVVRWSVKYFCSEFPDIPENSWEREEGETGKCKASCFASKHNKHIT